MKIGQLKSLGHNVADSFASGVGLPIGVWMTDVFGEAGASEPGFVEVDFISGITHGSVVSSNLGQAIRHYRDVLPEFCIKQGIEHQQVKLLVAKFGSDRVYGRHFTVTIESTDGRRSVDRYVGVPGRRVRTARG